MGNLKLHILLLLFVTFIMNAQNEPFVMETEMPITMSMTPLIDKTKMANEDSQLKFVDVAEEDYQITVLSNIINKISYDILFRVEDGLPIDNRLTVFRDLSFFDIGCNYEHKDFNFSILASNFFNWKRSFLELEPSLDRQSLVAEQVYFNHEVTSFIQVSIAYKF